MTTDKSVMPSLDQDEEGNLQIYIPRRNFGDFIQGLLSQPRSLGKSWKRFFDIDQNFIRHLHELLRQRVQSQQIASLASFQASIFFLDGRVITITSWDAFDSFIDNSDSVTTRSDIVWSYLVKFPSKPIPEKQTIAISFNTGVKDVDTTTRNDLIGRFIRWFILDDEGSAIAVKIEYTELTWGPIFCAIWKLI
jgi:hypothetical protein